MLAAFSTSSTVSCSFAVLHSSLLVWSSAEPVATAPVAFDSASLPVVGIALAASSGSSSASSGLGIASEVALSSLDS